MLRLSTIWQPNGMRQYGIWWRRCWVGIVPTVPASALMCNFCCCEETPNFGHYRYLFKGIGEAVYEALEDAQQPLRIQDLVTVLREGGLQTDARAVNASLLNMKGILKSPTGHYGLDPSDDGLPF